MAQDAPVDVDGGLSEKMRLALEKSWGYPVPTPRFKRETVP